MSDMDLTGRWRTAGGYIADVENVGEGVHAGLVDGNSIRWDRNGRCENHPEYDLVERISGPDIVTHQG